MTEVSVEAADPKLLQDLTDLGSEDPYLRQAAAERVLQRGPAAVTALTAMVQEHSHKGVPEAVRLLGRLRDRRSLGALIHALKMGNEDLRANAVWALTQINDPQALEELLQEAHRNNPAVQAYLAYTLSTIQDPRVVPTLVKLSQHTSREVSFQAIWALGETGDRAAILPLRKLLACRDALLRSAAESALRRLGGPVRRAYPIGLWVGVVMSVGLVWGLAGWFFYK